MKISYQINLLLLLCVGLAFLFGNEALLHKVLLGLGLFGLAGSLTNSLAIHMLFERIPWVYGSGIIALNFEEIKRDLEELMIRQFFNPEQIERFFSGELQGDNPLSRMGDRLNFSTLFDKFQAALTQSFQGNPLALLALPLLDANRTKIIEAMQSAVAEELAAFKGPAPEEFEQRVRTLIQGRLAEFTPQMVKEIIQHMIESKLMWLVVWGAIIGALIGLLSALLSFVWP